MNVKNVVAVVLSNKENKVVSELLLKLKSEVEYVLN